MASVDKIGRVSSSSVKKCTGKSWDEWIKILDKAGARGLTHKEIVQLLKSKYKLSLWWQQGVTSGYEQHIGRRVEGQNQKGEYATVATKTFPIDKNTVWKFLTSPKGLMVWLKPMGAFTVKPKATYEVYGGIFGEVRTMKVETRVSRMRLTWQEAEWPKPTIVTVLAVARSKDKCMVVIQHDGLRDLKLKARMLPHWKKALVDLLDACSK